jgi:hypothetical protein
MKFDPKNYYKAKEAQERLGIDRNRFNYLVRTERIKKHIPPGKAQGLYLKAEIDRYARDLVAFMVHDENKGITFSKATNEDIEEEYELACFMFGSSLVHGIETRREWLSKNPETDFIVRDEGELVAFLNALPVKDEIINQFMEGKIRGWDIKKDDILEYEKDSKLNCILMGMGTTPQAERARRTLYGSRLIGGFIGFLEDLANRGVEITKFYATSSTPTGIAILRNAEFKETGKIGKRIKFELDTYTSESILAKEYKKEIEKYKSLPQKASLV